MGKKQEPVKQPAKAVRKAAAKKVKASNWAALSGRGKQHAPFGEQPKKR